MLGGLGCHLEAEPLILQLYQDLGKEDTDEIFLQILDMMSIKSSTPAHLLQKSRFKGNGALLFNIEQMVTSFQDSAARVPNHRCTYLGEVNGSFLVGSSHSIHASQSEAASTCRRLGYSCAGITVNETGLFSVMERKYCFLLLRHSSQSWLHHCTVLQARHSRLRRQDTGANCNNEKEQRVHEIVQWIPGISTYYNLGTTVYYAIQNCTELAQDRALETILDVGSDALIQATGIVGYGITLGLKPRLKTDIKDFLNYLKQPTTMEQEIHQRTG
ncbi:apolipoprotein F [Rhinatrema bivittatum]|uniref:apolipoprotein F n=1 Tax=Rhinatrema bivittatum TaxID=194408 RepID=UPI00112E5B77|nr:apolipoprotein F [Rhinatrema bivittatum]